MQVDVYFLQHRHRCRQMSFCYTGIDVGRSLCYTCIDVGRSLFVTHVQMQVDLFLLHSYRCRQISFCYTGIDVGRSLFVTQLQMQVDVFFLFVFFLTGTLLQSNRLFINRRQDYCNSVMYGVGVIHLRNLQPVHNWVARVVARKLKYD